MIILERLSEVVGVSGSQKRGGVQTRSVTRRAPSRVPGRAEPTTPRLPGHGHRGVPGTGTAALLPPLSPRCSPVPEELSGNGQLGHVRGALCAPREAEGMVQTSRRFLWCGASGLWVSA